MLKDKAISAYQSILDESFRSQFSQWDTLSAWDPIKMIAEAMTLSLCAIEQRHQRLVETLVDSVPSLVGFSAHAAMLPGAKVELEAASNLKEPVQLKQGTVLRFSQEQGTLFCSLKSDVLLVPGGAVFQADVEVFEKTAELTLGLLKGEPWEVVGLPTSVAEVPQSVLVRFPDERVLELHLKSEGLLRDRTLGSQAFQFGFFYNAAKHALVIPASHEHLEGYEGGVKLQLTQAITFPQELASAASASFTNDFPKFLRGARFLEMTHAAVPRESAFHYLERFYSLVRQIPLQETKGFFPEQVCLDIAGSDPRIRKVEFCLRESKVVFFLLAAASLPESAKASVLCEVTGYLQGRVPLAFPFEVEFFASVPVEVSLECGEAETALICETLQTLIQPSPLGKLPAGESVSVAQLQVALAKHPLKSARLKLAVGSTRQFQDTLTRGAGQCFDVKVVNCA